MQKASCQLRLDTPLLLGGSRGELDRTGCIRPPSIRGLVRTYTRACLGRLSSDNANRSDWIRRREAELLGSAGGEDTTGNTWSVSVAPGQSKFKSGNFPIVPRADGPFKGNASGFVDGQQQDIRFTFRRRHDGLSPANAIQAATWVAFTLGSLGKRSRRGYGSLSIVRWEPTSGSALKLPVFDDVQDAADLAGRINRGLAQCLTVMNDWVANNSPVPAASNHEPQFFQLPGTDQIYISATPEPDGWEPLMQKFNRACHDQLGVHGKSGLYQREIGSPSRLASPVWMRIYRTAGGCVSVITNSASREKRVQTVVAALAGAVDGRPLPSLLKGAGP